MVDYCAVPTIQKRIELAAGLGLLSTSRGCRLTRKGQQALNAWDGVVGQAVIDYLHGQHGLTFDSLKSTIVKIKRAKNLEVPTAVKIHERLNADSAFETGIDVVLFVTLLNILGRCGLIEPKYKKYYWT